MYLLQKFTKKVSEIFQIGGVSPLFFVRTKNERNGTKKTNENERNLMSFNLNK